MFEDEAETWFFRSSDFIFLDQKMVELKDI